MNRIYEKLSSIAFLSKSYTFKFLFIAFLGIHIPLIGLIVFILFRPSGISAFNVLMVTLLLTLAATGVTLFVLNGLLLPLRKSRQALQDYLKQRQLPNLPVHYRDEAGKLMQNIQFTITELNDLLEEKKDLTALLSHDLRIPLRNVKTLANLLHTTQDAESVKEIADMIVESNQEQTDLLENILEILRQDHLFFNSNQNEQVPASALIDETIASFGAAAASKNILLNKDIRYSGNLAVQPELFRQVLKNLASNAIKFSFEGSEVEFAVFQQQQKTIIQVKDSGMGFDPEISEKLFERFTKNGRTGTAGEPTTGIGLYLSRKIVRHHQGELLAQSKGPGKGAVFSIALDENNVQ